MSTQGKGRGVQPQNVYPDLATTSLAISFGKCPTLCVGVKFGVLTCFGTQVKQLTFNNVKITFIDKKTILSANFIG